MMMSANPVFLNRPQMGCLYSMMQQKPCEMCPQHLTCPKYWAKIKKIVKMPSRTDRKYWAGNPDRQYHRR